jgi:hypothetical protein
MSSGRNSASSYNGDKTPAGNSVVLHMVRDAYANWCVVAVVVFWKRWKSRNAFEHCSCCPIVLPSRFFPQRQYTFAKHIVAKLVSLNGGSL